MKRRVARKILKRVKHETRLVANCILYLNRPSTYKAGTVHRAEVTLGLFNLEPKDLSLWGLLDLTTNTWLGTRDQPFTYDDEKTARASRQIIAARIPCSPLRISVEPFTSATKKLDDIVPENTLDEALDLIEQRGY
jgi:hypothetical protein